MQVVWNDGGKAFGGFKTYNTSEGISMVFHLKSDGASFIDADDDGSKLEICGKKARPKFFNSDGDISEDGKMIKIEMSADGAKAVDGKAQVKGSIAVVTGTETATSSTELIEWKKDTEVSFPEGSNLPTFTVSKVGKPDWGDEEFAITLKCKQDLMDPVSVKFVEEDGTEHEAKSDGYSRMSFGNNVTLELGYKTEKKFSKAKLVIEYWKDAKTVEVPVDMEVGL